MNLGGDIDFSEPINPVGLVGQLYLAVDRSGASTNNNVYMLASVQPTGFTTGSDVMFVRSTNDGQTFSAPRRINDDPVNHAKWHWFGALSVAPNGRLDAIWLDTRNAANNTDSQLFYSYSMDGGNTWAASVAVGNSFNPFLGYPNQNKMGDYMSIVSDNTGANVAYCATFNGEQDIYYVRVTPAPVATTLGNISTRAFVQTEPFLEEISRTVRQRDFSVPNIEVIPYFKDWETVPWHMLEGDHKNFFSRTSLRKLLAPYFWRVEVFSCSEHPLRTRDGIALHAHLCAVADKRQHNRLACHP